MCNSGGGVFRGAAGAAGKGGDVGRGYFPLCHGGGADGRGFGEGALRQKCRHASCHGQHHQDHDLHHHTGKRLPGRDTDGVRLCGRHAQGEAVHTKGGAVHGKGSALLPDAGIPQRLRHGACGACGKALPAGGAEKQGHVGVYHGGEQAGHGGVRGAYE